MSETVLARETPVIRAINAHVRKSGGSPVRFKMSGDRRQFSVTDALENVFAAETEEGLAAMLGVYVNGNGKAEKVKMISSEKAAKISGFSTTALRQAVLDGTLKCERLPIGRGRYRFLHDDVLEWARRRKEMGGAHLPRVRRRVPIKTVHVTGSRHSSLALTAAAMDRLDAYLEKLKGTVFEMTKTEFVSRVISQALDRLKS